MLRFISIVAAVVVALVTPVQAHAASNSAIYRDAADGRIDGTYTLAELRSADSQVSAEQREYYGWDAVYADAVQRLQDPEAAEKNPTVIPVDTNKNGKIDDDEKQAAQKKEAKLKKGVSGDTPEATPVDGDDTDGDDGDDDSAASKSKDDDDDGMSPLVWLLILVPLGVIGFGAWRMSKGDKPEDPDAR